MSSVNTIPQPQPQPQAQPQPEPQAKISPGAPIKSKMVKRPPQVVTLKSKKPHVWGKPKQKKQKLSKATNLSEVMDSQFATKVQAKEFGDERDEIAKSSKTSRKVENQQIQCPHCTVFNSNTSNCCNLCGLSLILPKNEESVKNEENEESKKDQIISVEKTEEEENSQKKVKVSKENESEETLTQKSIDYAIALQMQEAEQRRYQERIDLKKFYNSHSHVKDHISGDIPENAFSDPEPREKPITSLDDMSEEDLASRTKHDPLIASIKNKERLEMFGGVGNLAKTSPLIGNYAYNQLSRKLEEKKFLKLHDKR